MIETDQRVIRDKLPKPPFEVWIGGAAVYAGLSHFLPFLPPAGNTKIIDATLPALVTLWSALYGLGGLAVLVGLWRCSPRIEGAGINLLGSGLTVATLAALAAHAPILPTLVVSGGLVAACIWRLFQLRRTA